MDQRCSRCVALKPASQFLGLDGKPKKTCSSCRTQISAAQRAIRSSSQHDHKLQSIAKTRAEERTRQERETHLSVQQRIFPGSTILAITDVVGVQEVGGQPQHGASYGVGNGSDGGLRTGRAGVTGQGSAAGSWGALTIRQQMTERQACDGG